jgi:plastocyanin
MKKTIGVILLLTCAGLALAVSVARPASTAGSLTAVVGPGFSISLMQNGVKVSRLDPGDYTIAVDDKSSEHDFHLFGPGVNETTSVDGTGQATWNVTFQNGSYTYVCDAHVASMVGKFTVGDAPTTTTTTPPAAKPLKVKATVKAAKRVITVRAVASRSAKYDVTLWRGSAKVAHGTKATLRYVAKKPGRYVAKVVAKAGASTARASAAVSVK